MPAPKFSKQRFIFALLVFICSPVQTKAFLGDVAAFRGLGAVKHRRSFNTAGFSCSVSPVQPSADNTIIPSALRDIGGGWTIEGLKPPPKQGTVWARPRPKVGEVKTMGSGSFGEEVAVKAELDIGNQASPLKAEAEILIELQDGPGVPQVFWVGQRQLNGEICNVMVMELLGPDMESLLELIGRRQFSQKTGLMLGIQMLDALEHVHSKGIVHRDVKPENFLMGCKERANKVFLVDYGMSGWFIQRDRPGQPHVPLRSMPAKSELRGTVRYASINKHRMLEQSRRDDVEELCYVLVYLLKGPLPWQTLENPSTIDGLETNPRQREAQLRRIKEMKETLPVERLCEGLPRAISDMLTECRGLEYEAAPRYKEYRDALAAAVGDMGASIDSIYDWSSLAPPKRRYGFF